MAHCKGCGAPIRWVKTENGKAMPLDEKPTPEGNVVIVDGVAIVGGHNPALFTGEDLRYTSHFATCPKAGDFRRKSA